VVLLVMEELIALDYKKHSAGTSSAVRQEGWVRRGYYAIHDLETSTQ
jgi:hypothetical protein